MNYILVLKQIILNVFVNCILESVILSQNICIPLLNMHILILINILVYVNYNEHYDYYILNIYLFQQITQIWSQNDYYSMFYLYVQ